MKPVYLEITAQEKERSFLESLGIELGDYNESLGAFENCKADKLSLDSLKHYWGRIVWAEVDPEFGLLRAPEFLSVSNKNRAVG
jgi:hypothetical protein